MKSFLWFILIAGGLLLCLLVGASFVGLLLLSGSAHDEDRFADALEAVPDSLPDDGFAPGTTQLALGILASPLRSEEHAFLTVRVLPPPGKTDSRELSGRAPRIEIVNLFETQAKGSIAALETELAQNQRRLVLAMNAGMFHADGSAVGLHVHAGREMSPLNLQDGEGNFFLKPGGVFGLRVGSFRVVESHEWASWFTGNVDATPTTRVPFREATQSGPLLLRGGRIHSRILPHSPSRKVRNGVGVTADGNVHFVISEEPVTFYELTRAFQDLDCIDALYLDGTVSTLYAPDLRRMQQDNKLGPTITVSVPMN